MNSNELAELLLEKKTINLISRYLKDSFMQIFTANNTLNENYLQAINNL